MLLAMGGLFVTMDAMQLYAVFALGIALDSGKIAVLTVMGLLAPVCFWAAVVLWFRLKR
jgi:hypothetical protein